MDSDSATWLFVGSSPRVEQQLARARELFHIDVTITTNAGIYLCPIPDYYFISYQGKNSDPYIKLAQGAQYQGSRIIGWDFQIAEWPWFNIYLTRGKRVQNRFPLMKNHYKPLQYSGQICMHFACQNGAERVIIVGCEGYQPSTVWETCYFADTHKFTPDDKLKTLNEKVIAPQTEMICECWPDVEFICIGQPTYEINQPNWRVVPCPTSTADEPEKVSSPTD